MGSKYGQAVAEKSFETLATAATATSCSVRKMNCSSKTPKIQLALIQHQLTMFLWPLISGLLFSNAQYSAPLLVPHPPALLTATCDSGRLIRCQQDALRDMQVVSLNAASVQYPISSGPPYSPSVVVSAKQQQQVASSTICRLVRANLDCLLVTTPACYETGLQAAQNHDIILRAKRFLEQNQCNDPDTSWQTTFCYRQPDLRSCEERYGFTSLSSSNLVANLTACLAYQAFKYCVDSHLRLNCKVHEMDMVNEYLIDRAGDLAWRCPYNQSSTLHYNSSPYALSNNPTGSLLSPVAYGHQQHNYGNNYEQRPLPTYSGPAHSDGVSLFGTVRDRPWERFRNPHDEVARFGISRQPGFGLAGSGGGSGEVFDRLVAGAGFDAETSDCPIKAAPYVRECEDTLSDQQRLARDSRDGSELQRRVCCSLFQYRDCISRVVLDRCADSSPAAVEILMGVRRREMTITCRGFNRDLCSGASLGRLTNPLLMLAASLVATFMVLKQERKPVVLF